jgi:hypothetical protein
MTGASEQPVRPVLYSCRCEAHEPCWILDPVHSHCRLASPAPLWPKKARAAINHVGLSISFYPIESLDWRY